MAKIAAPKKKINKLFLVGNGLDLALGLKTSYQDFILWLTKKFIFEAYNSNIKTAPKPYTEYSHIFRKKVRKNVFGFSRNDLFDVLLNNENKNHEGFNISKIKSLNEFSELKKYCNRYEIQINTKYKEGLFEQILKNSELGWVDIERIYFEKIKLILKNKKLNGSFDSFNINTINKEMTSVKELLFEYLNEIKIDLNEEKIKVYLRQFGTNINLDNYTFLSKQEKLNLKFDLEKPLNYFLNFNYTNSLNVLLRDFNSVNSINHIHGRLLSGLDSIIFGFGDEMDATYKEIEELNDNRFFKHIKSFQYFKSPKYKELLSFVNSNDFHVYIYGHSCGLSDRIMLNEIFEHENCKAIKIYYRDEKDYDTKTMEISRHFNSNKEMRRKILDFDPNCRIPQVNE